MSGHTFHKPLGSLELDVCHLYGNFAVGGTGAVGTVSAKGTSTVVRNSAGKYTITLDDTYNTLLWASVELLHNAADNPTTAGILCRLVSANAQAAGGGQLVIQFVSVTDGSAIDPASGATVYFKLELRNSSVT